MAQYYDLNMNNQRIYNCLDPAAAQDVATRNYVDERALAYTAEGQIQYAGPSPFLPTTLSVGANGDVLTVAGGVPTWAVNQITGGSAGGYLKVAVLGFGEQNYIDNVPHLVPYDPNFGQGYWWGGVAVNAFQNIGGGSQNGLQYTGTNVIQVSFSFNPIFNVSSTLNPSTPFNVLSNTIYYNSGFGINLYITDSAGNIRADQPSVTDMSWGGSATNSVDPSVYNDFRSVFNCSFILRQNDIIRVNAVSNGVFNQSGQYAQNTLLFQGSSFTDGTYMTLTCIEVNSVS
jgi:hypothetical protein